MRFTVRPFYRALILVLALVTYAPAVAGVAAVRRSDMKQGHA
ncbi:MAG TPA: hypothetical protein VKZ94_18765 [Advenella sp.]|nr:hypothetical protein [Advenella sp.]